MSITRWSRIPRFPDYEVGSSGVVRRIETGRPLGLRENQSGLVYVRMNDSQGIQQARSLAKLVADAFVPTPHNYDREQFDTPICMNGDRYDCSVENLTWRPLWFARDYNRQFATPYRNRIRKLIIEEHTGVRWMNSISAAAGNGLLEKDVVLSILNRTFVWPTYQMFYVAGDIE